MNQRTSVGGCLRGFLLLVVGWWGGDLQASPLTLEARFELFNPTGEIQSGLALTIPLAPDVDGLQTLTGVQIAAKWQQEERRGRDYAVIALPPLMPGERRFLVLSQTINLVSGAVVEGHAELQREAAASIEYKGYQSRSSGAGANGYGDCTETAEAAWVLAADHFPYRELVFGLVVSEQGNGKLLLLPHDWLLVGDGLLMRHLDAASGLLPEEYIGERQYAVLARIESGRAREPYFQINNSNVDVRMSFAIGR